MDASWSANYVCCPTEQRNERWTERIHLMTQRQHDEDPNKTHQRRMNRKDVNKDILVYDWNIRPSLMIRTAFFFNQAPGPSPFHYSTLLSHPTDHFLFELGPWKFVPPSRKSVTYARLWSEKESCLYYARRTPSPSSVKDELFFFLWNVDSFVRTYCVDWLLWTCIRHFLVRVFYVSFFFVIFSVLCSGSGGDCGPCW